MNDAIERRDFIKGAVATGAVILTSDHAEQIGLGTQNYELVEV